MVYDFEYTTPTPSQSKGMIVLVMILALGLVGSTTFILIQSQQIASLQAQVDQLESELSDLESNYDSLFSDYETLREAFEEPLTDPVTPTISQVRTWLRQDDTDSFPYEDGLWTCGDYSAMLMTRAKERNWRIRIAVIFYSLEGESGYGDTSDMYGSYGHSFCVIECTDGIWYIEPQSDATWYLVKTGTEDRIEFYPHWYYHFEDSTSGTLWDGYTFFVNFYSQFA